MRDIESSRRWLCIALVAGIAACGPGSGGGNGDGGTDSGVRIAGIVTGLQGTGLTLQLNGGDALAIERDGAFEFPERLDYQAEYTVTVGQQPTAPPQTCEVVKGTGVAIASVHDVTVNCKTENFAVSGLVDNLIGDKVVLSNNGRDLLNVFGTATGAANFTFVERLTSGSSYAVRVERHPTNPTQNCTVTRGAGTINGADITNVQVSCAAVSFSVGGRIEGLEGTTVVLRNNGGDSLTLSQDGPFTFSIPIASGTNYNVSIHQQPVGRTCSVYDGSGRVGDLPVTSIVVTCGPTAYTVSGNVSGLQGSGLVLRNNNSDDLAITSDGPFTFPSPVAGGSPYDVTVAAQPTNPWQTCVVTNGQGPGTGDVTDVQVTCTTNSYSVGGFASGATSGLILQLNGGNDLAVSTTSSFTFPGELLSGTAYNVTVASEPTGRDCTVSNGSGTITSSDVTNVFVSCIVEGDTRANALPLDVSSGRATFSVDTTGSRNDATYCNCTSSGDLFLSFSLPVASFVYADNFGSPGDPSLYLQNSAGTNVTNTLVGGAACNDDSGCGGLQSQLATLVPAGSYFLVIDGCTVGPVQGQLLHFPAPSGTVTNLAAGTSTPSGTLSGGGAITASCAASSGAENAYWWRSCPAYAGGSFSASTCSLTSIDTSLELLSSLGGNTCSDNACGTQSSVSTTIAAGAGLHVLYVDSVGDALGATYSVSITRP